MKNFVYLFNLLFFFFFRSISPNTIGNIVISPLVRRDDSLSSSASSYMDDTVRPLALTAPAAVNTKQQLYNDGTEQRKIMSIHYHNSSICIQ